MSGPTCRDLVTLVVPKREQISARVEDTAAGWLDLAFMASPRTAMPKLLHSRVYVQFAGADGLCRMAGELTRRPQDARLRIVGYGLGEILRFSRRGNIQLLRRADSISAKTSARIVVIRAGSRTDVAAEGRCLEFSATSMRLFGIHGARTGEVFEFDLVLEQGEAPVCGELRVERSGLDGMLEARITKLSNTDRGRLVAWAADHQPRRVAS